MKSEPEWIDIVEFANRLGISRTTAFEWMRKGDLVQGVHYLKIGRVIRFPWAEELTQSLVKSSLEITPQIRINQSTVNPIAPVQSGATIDLDYR